MKRDPLFVLLAALAGITSLALGVSGEASLLALLVPAAALRAVLWPITKPPTRYYTWFFNAIAAMALLIVPPSIMGYRILPLAGAVLLTVPIHLYSLLQLPTRKTLLYLQLISFFQLVALAAATTRVLFGPLLVVHLAILPMTLTLRALESAQDEPRRPARWDAGFMRAALFASTVMIVGGVVGFMALPRYEAGMFAQFSQPSQRLSGFSETVTFGDITRIQTSSRIVMRVKLSGDVPHDVRYRGIALDRFTGREWTVTAPRESQTLISESIDLAPSVPRSKRFVQEFSLERLSPTALFAAPRAVRVLPKDFPGVKLDPWGNISRTFGTPRRLSYEVVSEQGKDDSALPPELRDASLQLPELDDRVRALAREAAGEGSDAERARAIERWLPEHCAYTLDVNDVGVEDPIATFLLDRRRGHCEYFASAMVVLLRIEGIPARLVDGFQAGERSRFFGHQIVRQRDAHSWVEAWIAGRGWTTFDPTPGDDASASVAGGARSLWSDIETLWDDNVIGFNFTFQIGYVEMLREAIAGVSTFFSGSGGMLGLSIAIAVIASLMFTLRRQHARARSVAGAPPWYVAALRLMARRTQPRRPAQTPAEYARAFATSWPGAPGEAALELTRLYHEARMGGRDVDEARARELLGILRVMTSRRRVSGRRPSTASS